MTDPAPTCTRCGTTVEQPPLTWSLQVSELEGRTVTRWLCENCTRADVRSIEARLDEAWW